MLSLLQKKKIIQFAKSYADKNDQFHKMSHINKTAELAVWLAKIENGDEDVCWASAMLHDICRSKPGDHGTEGAKIAEKFLLGLGLDKDFVEQVRNAIYFHNKEFKEGPIERQIVWDADKLQMLGIKGFEERLLSAYKVYFGEKDAVKNTMVEYKFFAVRFHTKTGQNEVKKNAKKIEEYFTSLETSG